MSQAICHNILHQVCMICLGAGCKLFLVYVVKTLKLSVALRHDNDRIVLPALELSLQILALVLKFVLVDVEFIKQPSFLQLVLEFAMECSVVLDGALCVVGSYDEGVTGFRE